MSELIDKVFVDKDQQSFTDLRKLAACNIVMEDEDITGEDAATAADKSVFQKCVDCAVGQCEMAADQAVDCLIDRAATYVATFLHNAIKTAVEYGCDRVCGYIGGFFGPTGRVVAHQIATQIAAVLNSNISDLIDEGMQQVKEIAKILYEKGKAKLKEFAANKLSLFC